MKDFRVGRGWALVLFAVSFGTFAGCGNSGLDLAPVEGVVTYQGTPLAEAGVLFVPTKGPYAMGVTDSDGRFTLVTANHEGALIGEHKVSISKADTIVRHVPGNPMPIYDTKPLIPAKYFDGSTSELTANVQDDDNEFEFDLRGSPMGR